MGRSASWLRELRSLLPAERPPGTVSAADLDAFAAECEARLDPRCRVLVGLMLTCTLLWWPTDALVFRRLPAIGAGFALWRAVTVACCLVFLLAPRTPWVRRHVLAVFVGISMVSFVTIGYVSGREGGPEQPYGHMLNLLALCPIALPVAFPRRLVVTGLFTLSPMAGYFFPFPQHVGSPHFLLWLSFFVCMFAVSLAIGHSYHALSRDNFLQARELERNGEALRGHSEHLEARVAEQTRELRRLLANLESAREDERARLSREVHDQLGQELSALRYTLAFTRRRFAAEPQQIGPNLVDLDGLVARTAATARAIVTDLRPRLLDDLGLRAALEWLIDRTGQRTGMACAFTVAGDEVELDDQRAIGVFRVLQESLTNVVRHAEAHRVDVTLTTSSEALELLVRDDGVGFVPGAAGSGSGGGAGLAGMSERARSIGGELSVESRPGAGTELRLRLPLAGPASSARGGA